MGRRAEMEEAEVKMADGNSDDQTTDSNPGSDPGSTRKIASWLAANFSSLLKRQKRLKTLKEFGPIRYTEDMAVTDLTSISVNTGSEKVQTSSISNIPERVAMMLASGYVEKMQEKMNQEYEDMCGELKYVSWQLDIIDAAMEERMTERQRVVFRWVYLEKMSLRYIHDNLMPLVSLFTIKAERDRTLRKLEDEVGTRAERTGEEVWYSQARKEAEREAAGEKQGGDRGSRVTNRVRRVSKKSEAKKAGTASESTTFRRH